MMRVIDFHCDTMGERIARSEGKVSLRSNDCHISLEKMQKGEGLAQFFAIWIPLHDTAKALGVTMEPYEYFNFVYGKYLEEMEKNKDIIAPAFCLADIERNRANGLMTSILSIEDSVPLDGKIERVQEFYDKGVRLMSLTWNYENSVAYPTSEDPEIMKKGLKPFGLEVIAKMNELGMIIDVSHLNDAGIFDVFKHTKKPIVASHSNARALCNHRRNLTDEMLKLLGENGGLTGLNYCAPFMSEEAAKNNLTTCDDIVRHALYIKNKAGIDAVAFGSDFDGIGNALDFGDYSGMPKVIDALSKHFTDDEIEKICWKNAYRVIGESMK
ncbi:MAG: dipeptidase [Clostridia bacterium]|nr:dipeptidase [Clostridia bacterium]MBQ5813506.1 dipeptidase [Clostridia bacterium]